MAEQLFTNNGDATMSGTLAQGGLSFTLGAGQGADFPAPAGGDYFLGTIYEKDGAGVETKLEVVKVTTRTADTLDIVRDFESMTGQVGGYAYDGNTTTVYFSLRYTAHAAGQVLQKQDNLAGLASAATARTNIGLGNVDNTSDANKPVSTAQAAADAAVLAAAQALVVGLWDDRGNFDASVNTYPTTGGSGTASAILKGDIWTVSVVATSGVLLGIAVGSTVRALVDTPGQTAGNWDVLNVGIGYVPENAANKDASGGYPGLTLFKLNLRNAANTITSWFTTAATVARTWTMPDKDGTVAMISDITGTNSGTNTGDETGARIATLHHAASAKSALVDADEIAGQDSAASFGLIRSTWANVKAFLKTYFDGLYQAIDAQLSSLVRQNSQSAAYTLVLGDSGKSIYHPSADTTARTWTIPANSSVAFPIGTAITFDNDNGAGVITIAITTDTMRLAGAGTTGSRTLAANGIATAIKNGTTSWKISGTGLT